MKRFTAIALAIIIFFGGVFIGVKPLKVHAFQSSSFSYTINDTVVTSENLATSINYVKQTLVDIYNSAGYITKTGNLSYDSQSVISAAETVAEDVRLGVTNAATMATTAIGSGLGVGAASVSFTAVGVAGLAAGILSEYYLSGDAELYQQYDLVDLATSGIKYLMGTYSQAIYTDTQLQIDGLCALNTFIQLVKNAVDNDTVQALKDIRIYYDERAVGGLWYFMTHDYFINDTFEPIHPIGSAVGALYSRYLYPDPTTFFAYTYGLQNIIIDRFMPISTLLYNIDVRASGNMPLTRDYKSFYIEYAPDLSYNPENPPSTPKVIETYTVYGSDSEMSCYHVDEFSYYSGTYTDYYVYALNSALDPATVSDWTDVWSLNAGGSGTTGNRLISWYFLPNNSSFAEWTLRYWSDGSVTLSGGTSTGSKYVYYGLRDINGSLVKNPFVFPYINNFVYNTASSISNAYAGIYYSTTDIDLFEVTANSCEASTTVIDSDWFLRKWLPGLMEPYLSKPTNPALLDPFNIERVKRVPVEVTNAEDATDNVNPMIRDLIDDQVAKDAYEKENLDVDTGSDTPTPTPGGDYIPGSGSIGGLINPIGTALEYANKFIWFIGDIWRCLMDNTVEVGIVFTGCVTLGIIGGLIAVLLL